MQKLYDLLDLMKVRLNELEEMLDDLQVAKNEKDERDDLATLRDEQYIKEMVDYWLEKDFNELKDLIDEVVK